MSNWPTHEQFMRLAPWAIATSAVAGIILAELLFRYASDVAR